MPSVWNAVGSSTREVRRDDPPTFSNLASWAANRTSAKRRKMRPRTGAEYSWDLRPELARNWSAASQRRFSSAALSVSFSDGAIQIMNPARRVFQSGSTAKDKDRVWLSQCPAADVE